MAMIIDAIARHGAQGAIRSILSLQNATDEDAENSTLRYACARKRYESGRKGPMCVYRISDERRNCDGHRVRLYTNVEGANLDEDEPQSFTGIEYSRNYNMGRSMRQKKGRTPPTPDKVIKSKVELERLDVEPYPLTDEGSDRRSKSDNTAPSQAKRLSLSSSPNKEFGVREPVSSRKHLRRRSHSDSHRGVSVVKCRRSPSRALKRRKAGRFSDRTSRARPIQEELETYCSGALPIPQHQRGQLSLDSALTDPSRQLRETAVDSTIELVDDTSGVVKNDQVNGERDGSVVSEAPGSPFVQPGLTLQESSDLVFGTGSKINMRRKLRVGRMDDRIAPDVHEFASQLVRDDPLGETEQKTEACSASRKPYALGLEHVPSGVSETEDPLESRAQVLVSPSRTVTSTWISKMNSLGSASALHHSSRNRPPILDSSVGALHDTTRPKVTQFPLKQPLRQAPSGMVELVYAQASVPSIASYQRPFLVPLPIRQKRTN